jgi:signal transduction histidine kinase
LGNALAGRTSIPVAVTVSGQGALPAEVQVVLYRLCQEALNNITKHAGARHVVIQLQQTAGEVKLNIRDDGRGFDLERVPPGHYGLSIMRERADAIGATLSATSRPGHGTEIAIHWSESRKPEVQ